MVNVVMLIVVTIIFSVITMGIGYLVWVKTRPKKIAWIAKIYQVGEGIIPPLKDDSGKVISDIELKDLRPFATDILERVEKEKGIKVYRLISLNKTTPEVTADCIENWGKGRKEVSVLMQGETCTLLRKGYDKNGKMIFNPMPYDRVNMITNEMSIRKDRLRKDKDILQAVLPYVVLVVCIIGLVAMAYVLGDAYVKISDNLKDTQINHDEMMEETTDRLSEIFSYGASRNEVTPVGIQEPPPSIE